MKRDNKKQRRKIKDGFALPFLVAFIALALTLGGLAFVLARETGLIERLRKGPIVQTTKVDLKSFERLANKATCADIKNDLFLIDNKFVFWRREGRCPDNRYQYTLFGSKIEDQFCISSDSIAGRMQRCVDESYKPMFETILTNLEKQDLGLGASYKVESIFP